MTSRCYFIIYSLNPSKTSNITWSRTSRGTSRTTSAHWSLPVMEFSCSCSDDSGWNRVFLKRNGRNHGQSQAEVTLISHVMGAISTGLQIVSVTGSHTAQLLDNSPYGQYVFQSPPRFEELQLRSQMPKKSSSVFGHINFGKLNYLVVSLGSSLALEWVVRSPELSKVIRTITGFSSRILPSVKFCVVGHQNSFVCFARTCWSTGQR